MQADERTGEDRAPDRPGASIDVLLIEDSLDDAELAERSLRQVGLACSVRRIETGEELRSALDDHRWDLIICDHGLPRFGVFDALEVVAELGPDVPFLVLSGHFGEEAAVQALKAGAADVILKSNIGRLGSVALRELGSAAARRSRHHAETALRESDARKTAILESVLDAIITIDAEGRVVEFNRAAETIFGYERHEVIGQEMAALIVPPEMRQRHRDGMTKYLASGQPTILNRRLTLSAMRRNGTEFPVEFAVVAIELPGQTMFTAHLRDITGQERLQRELQQAQRLESLGLLAGGVAHDFNNLLGVIMNYAHFVKAEVSDNVQANADVDAIIQAAEQAAQLTRQLLAFGRREVVHPRVIALNDVLGEVERFLGRTVGEHLQVRSSFDAELWPVFADPGQLEQVILNLALNARDAMAGGGTLSFRTENLVLDTIAAGQFSDLVAGRYVRLAVSDTGSGMDAATQSRAFEPFFTTKRKGEGTGLGLATCYGIVRQSGGDIHIYSEVDRGTTISVYLPAAPESVATSVGTEPTVQIAGGHEAVLIVEDEDAFREMARRIVEAAGYTAVTASNADEGLGVIDARVTKIDLVLTDIVMPGRSGIELADQLRATHPEIPVIFMSGYAETVAQGTTQINPEDLVAKPFTQAAILERIRTTLDRSKPPPVG